MYTINDIAYQVVDKLRNRSDLNWYEGKIEANIPSWIYLSVLDLTQNFQFEELVIKGPLLNFRPGVAEYDISYFEKPGTTKFTQIRHFFRFFTTQNPPPQPLSSGTSTTGSIIKSRAPGVVEPMSVIPGLPSLFCQNGTRVLFGPCPNDSYTCFMRYQQEHPFNINTLPKAIIQMPNDWQEVLTYAAALKGAEHVGATDLANLYYARLHGDPKRPKDIGLLAQKRSQQSRNLEINERQMQPIVSRY